MIYPGPGTDTENLPGGRNLESIAEAFTFTTGTFYYASEVLKDPPAGLTSFYEGVKDSSLLLTKFTTTSARVLWYLRDSGYATSVGGAAVPSFMPDFFKNFTLTSGNVIDTGYNANVAFTAGPQTPNTCE